MLQLRFLEGAQDRLTSGPLHLQFLLGTLFSTLVHGGPLIIQVLAIMSMFQSSKRTSLILQLE